MCAFDIIIIIIIIIIIVIIIVMEQWWERSPPTNVARVQIPALTPYVGGVCCWLSPLLREVFLPVLRFFPLLKIQHFHIPIRPGIS